MHERPRQRHPLPLPPRNLLDRPGGKLARPDPVQRPRRGRRLVGEALQGREERQVLTDCELPVQAGPVREQAHPGPPRRIRSGYRRSVQPDITAVRFALAAEHPEQGRLAGTVRSEDRQDRSAPRGDVHAVHRPGGTVVADQLPRLEPHYASRRAFPHRPQNRAPARLRCSQAAHCSPSRSACRICAISSSSSREACSTGESARSSPSASGSS